MTRALRLLFALFGAVVIAIGLGIYFAGPHATAGFFDVAVSSLLGAKVYAGGLDGANTGSEMRFFSVFWMAYGAALLWFGRDPREHRRSLLLLLALFFAGGVGRQLAHLSSGQPDLMFVVLGWMELGLPLILAALLFSQRRAA